MSSLTVGTVQSVPMFISLITFDFFCFSKKKTFSNPGFLLAYIPHPIGQYLFSLCVFQFGIVKIRSGQVRARG